MNISNLRLRTKLGLSFFIVVLLTVTVGAFALSQMSRINASMEELANDWIPSLQAVASIRSLANENRRAKAQHALATDAGDMAQQEQRLSSDRTKLAKALARYEPLISSPEERQLAKQLKGQIVAYTTTSNKLVALSRDPTKVQATRDYFGGESRAALLALLTTANRLVEVNSAGAQAAQGSASSAFSASRTWVISLVLVAVGVASLLAV